MTKPRNNGILSVMNRREWKRQQRRRFFGEHHKLFIIIFSVTGVLLITAATVLIIMHDKKNKVAEDTAETPVAVTEGAKEKVVLDMGLDLPASGEEAPEETEEASNFSLSEWKENHTRVKGIYVTGPVAGSERMDGMIKLMDETELNAMVIDIKNDGGEITFKMEEDTEPGRLGNCVRYIRDIKALMQTLKEHNVYTIARIVSFKDPLLAEKRPELALYNEKGELITDGNDLAWVNPCKEEVWEYLTEIAEYSADLGFDEIQYDYVRFPVGEEAEKADYGVELTPENKHTYITGFLNYASERLHKKGIPVTADLFGTIIGNPIDVGQVGQDYVELAQAADALCPMIYPSHYAAGVFGLEVPDAQPYEAILAALEKSKDELKDVPEESKAVIRPWLQDFSAPWVEGHITYGIDEINAQIKAVYDAGYEEWILWNARNNYTMAGSED